MPTYNVIISVRDEEKYLYDCLSSILNQTVLPEEVCIIDDGSTDNTVNVISDFFPQFGIKGIQLSVYHTFNKRRDYTRIGSLWNKGLRATFDYHLIVDGDCVLEGNDYVQRLMTLMENDEKLVVASGDFGEVKEVHQPWGACRLVKNSWFFKHVKSYPYKLGFESYIIELALNMEYRTAVFKDIKFKHLKPLGKARTFAEEGRQMRNLGYHPLYAFLRILSQKSFSKGLQMLLGYLFYIEKAGNPYYEKFDEQFRRQLSKRQYRKIANIARNLI